MKLDTKHLITLIGLMLVAYFAIPRTVIASPQISNKSDNTVTIITSENLGNNIWLSEPVTNRKTLSRLRERVLLYLSFRVNQPKAYLLVEETQPYFEFKTPPGWDRNNATTFKFILPKDLHKFKHWDTTFRYLPIPEANKNWDKNLYQFDKKRLQDLESQIQSIRFKDNDDNFAYVVLSSGTQFAVQEIQLWMFSNNDWYPYRENHLKMEN
ncbi:MAG: hypothetical protein ACE14V_16540 [bacterium]